jgi:SPP1 gp7 family putative phage head morphogenesis protein
MVNSAKPRVGKPLHPNAGIAASYRRALERLIDEMNNSLLYWLTARWRDDPPQLAMDESWISGLRRTMRVLQRRWQSRFDEMAPKLAAHFAESVADRSTANLRRVLDEGGMTVDFKLSPHVRIVHGAVVAENVQLIKSIAQEHLTDVQGIVMRSVTTGRDLEHLARELRERFDVPKARAELIARDQNNKASAVITRARQQEVGIDQAIWVHSHAGKHPRPEHVAFAAGRLGGPVYDVAKGAFLEGVWTWPGVEINCRCFSRPVLPGLV